MDKEILVTFAILFFIIFVWFLICVPIGFLADNRGRSFWNWTIFSMLTSPIIGLILVLSFGNTEARRREILETEAEIFELAKKRYSNLEQQSAPLNINGKTVNDLYKK